MKIKQEEANQSLLFPVLGVKGQMSTDFPPPTAKTPAACTNNGEPSPCHHHLSYKLYQLCSSSGSGSSFGGREEHSSARACVCWPRLPGVEANGALLQIGSKSRGIVSLFALFLRQYWLSCKTSQGRIIVCCHHPYPLSFITT